jgi:hypothetical protein
MTAAKKPPLVALTTFTATDKAGVEHLIRTGDVVAGDHPAVKGREELFGPHDPAKPTVQA